MFNNKISNFFLILAFIIATISSCKRGLLETAPRDQLTSAIALSDFSGVTSVLNSAYRKTFGFIYYGQRLIVAGEVLSDNAIIFNNTGRYVPESVNARFEHFGIWTDFQGSTEGAAANAWTVINDCNVVIKFAPIAPDGTNADKARVVAEAKFLRALAYHNLAKVYGYEPNARMTEVGNVFNLAVPIRTTPTEVLSDAKGVVRATNVEVYTLIKKDLLDAIGVLGYSTSATRNKASRNAAEALLARVYLYEGNWVEATKYANGVISNSGGSVLMTPANLIASHTASTTFNPESLFELEIRSSDWGGGEGTNNALASMFNSQSGGIRALTASDELLASYEAGDVRRGVWVNGPGLPLKVECKKWSRKHDNAQGIDWIPVLRLSEMHLIIAEAASETGGDAIAVATVNALRAQRGLPALTAANSTGQNLKNAILRERRVEFAAEGHRWFDLKRKGIDIQKPLVSVTAGAPATIPATSFLMLANIPQDEININPALKQNPGY